MQVKVMNRVYRMGQEEYRGLLEVASEQVPFGIYAVEKSIDRGCLSAVSHLWFGQLSGGYCNTGSEAA